MFTCSHISYVVYSQQIEIGVLADISFFNSLEPKK